MLSHDSDITGDPRVEGILLAIEQIHSIDPRDLRASPASIKTTVIKKVEKLLPPELRAR